MDWTAVQLDGLDSSTIKSEEFLVRGENKQPNIYIHTFIYIYIYTYIHTYIHIHLYEPYQFNGDTKLN